MSSLAATQADGYYLPPEYFEGGAYKKQSKNAFFASQDGDKKRKAGHNQYLQRGVVRFELPYKGVCEGCHESIGRGTRYNAQKSNAGRYFSTPIYQFDMKSRKCQHLWIIRTNPQERGFDYVKGVQIQAGQEINLAMGDSVVSGQAKATGAVDLEDDDDVMLHQLESAAHGKRRALTEMEKLQRIQKLNATSILLDADNNALVRHAFRKDRKAKRIRQDNAKNMGWRRGMELLSNDKEEDIVASKEATYGRPREDERERLRLVRLSSIFSSTTRNKSGKGRHRKQQQLQRMNNTSALSTSPVRSSHEPNINNVVPVSSNLAAETSEGTTRAKRSIQIASVKGSMVSSRKKQPTTGQASSLSAMMAVYDSSDDD
jgi:coiled-coil domain-containing protein 130